MTTPALPRIPARAIAAWGELQQQIDELGPTPCNGRDEWISEAPEDREYAAGHCRGCPVLTACGAYADAAKEKTNVWGGTDRTLKPGQSIALFNIEEKSA